MSQRSAPESYKEDRLSIRADRQQKSLLARAARAQHMNVSQFVLQASLREAQQVLRDETQMTVSPEEYVWLCEVMDAPAAEVPRLRTALQQKPVWDA